MIPLSQASILEKNKISDQGVWLMLLELVLSETLTVRLVNNTEAINYQGNEFIPFPFSIEDITEDGKQLPNVNLQVSNATGAIQEVLEEHNGLGGSKAKIIVVAIQDDSVIEMLEEQFIVVASSCDNQWATLTLGTDFAFNQRFPPTRIMKDYCPFPFKGIQCGYKGHEGRCNKTLANCRKLKNSERFGGEPTIPQGGVYASNN